MGNSKANFVLKEFRQDAEFRVFTFERIAADRARSVFSVRADLALARRHRIPLQELPLLCKGLLEQLCESESNRIFVFTEVDMSLYAHGVAERAEAAKQRKSGRRPHMENAGVAWRANQVR